MKVLVIMAHPRTPSFNASLADAYVSGVESAGLEVKSLNLGQMTFDTDVHTLSPTQQTLEPDLEQARRLIDWCEHVTFVFPAWWGTGPALLKGFLDRVLLPGFAFKESSDGSLVGLLHGKTAHLITTMDMPPWVYRVIYRAPGHQGMKRATLGFCGIKTTRIFSIGPVRESDLEQRAAWLEKTRALGFSLSTGPMSRRSRIAAKVIAWLKALRLQFYPMTWMAYTVGALGAQAAAGHWDLFNYWIGYVVLFFGEAATVFINERYDYDSDRRNRQFGPFNGGSRVLVQKALTFREINTGSIIALGIAAACSGILLDRLNTDLLPIGLALLSLLFFGIGYTAPPLKLSWRGLGELTVGLTHSVVVIAIGFLLQRGEWNHPFIWLISLPLFIAVLPSITLSGIPDREADRLAGKKTLAVRFSHQRVIMLCMLLTILAPLAVLLMKDSVVLYGSFDGILAWILPHAMLILFLLERERRTPSDGRIDKLMIATLSYIIWFALFPLINLL